MEGKTVAWWSKFPPLGGPGGFCYLMKGIERKTIN